MAFAAPVSTHPRRPFTAALQAVAILLIDVVPPARARVRELTRRGPPRTVTGMIRCARHGASATLLALLLGCGPSTGGASVSDSESRGDATGDAESRGMETDVEGAEDSAGESEASSLGSTSSGAMTTASTESDASGSTASTGSTSSGLTTTSTLDATSGTANAEDTLEVETTSGDPSEPMTRVYILFGQSNMWGQTEATAEDMDTNPRIEVLTMDGDCPGHGPNEWVTAAPSLHGCVGNPGQGSGAGLGPGDGFAKTLAEADPDDTILLVPNAIPGASINCFAPPGTDFGATNNCPLGAGPTYESILARSQMAQARGDIRGILFHQGESDCGQDDWPERVKLIVDRLRADLGVGDVPFLAAEIPGMSLCQDHNRLFEGVGGITDIITNAFVVEAEDLPIYDTYHFTTEAQRTLGVRFGEMMLQVE